MTTIRKYDADGSTSDRTDAVRVFVETLERCGATFAINAHEDLRANLDGLGPPPPYADALSASVLALAEPIKAFLALRSVEGIRH